MSQTQVAFSHMVLLRKGNDCLPAPVFAQLLSAAQKELSYICWTKA